MNLTTMKNHCSMTATEQDSRSRNVNVHTGDLNGNQVPLAQDSPTSVADEDLTLYVRKNATAGDTTTEQATNDVPNDAALTETTHRGQLSLPKFQFTFDRKTITTGILSVITTLLFLAMATACCIGLAALLTSPLWLPLVIFTSPVWFPILLLSSPVWLTFTVLLCATVAFWTILIVAVLLFFAWPAEWLPSNSTTTTWFLRRRDAATIALIKLQAKIVLYAAGVGPLADAALMILDRVDLVTLQKTLQEFNAQEWMDQMRQMDLQQLQAALMQALWSLVKVT
jgi:hypothetical protein